LLGRITGGLVIVGAVAISLTKMDVFDQLQLTWVFPVLFAAPFWIGMYWRRATTTAAWCTVTFCALMFFLIPFLTPIFFPELRHHAGLLTTSPRIRTTVTRTAAPSDIRQRREQITLWDAARQEMAAWDDPTARSAAIQQLGQRPRPLVPGELLETQIVRGGESVFWGGGVHPVDADGNMLKDLALREIGTATRQGNRTMVEVGYAPDVTLRGFGNLRLDFLVYELIGVELGRLSDATLSTLELFPKIILPFLVMISCSLMTRRNSPPALDRYYAKMKTPVTPDHQQDEKNLVSAYADPAALENKKLFPGSDFEFQKPSLTDVLGFIACLIACFLIIAAAAWATGIGS
jgi:SSS family solute:Na+ symporter